MVNLFRKIYQTLLHLMLIGAIASIIAVAFLESRLPQVEILKDVKLQVPMKIFSSDGLLIAEYGDKRLSPISIADVPNKLKEAVLATEDRRFYQHPGVDYRGLARAVVSLIVTGNKEQGGSTITMQVARNFFLTKQKTYLRKINEILLALKIEQELGKEEIFELYLNKIYFGKRAYGVAAAAEVYYGKDVVDLTLPQIAMIAGLPQAPSSINPLASINAANKRRTHVLDRMLAYNYINKSEYDSAIKSPEDAYYHPKTVELRAPYIAEMVRQKMLEQYGDLAYEQGFEVITTVHSEQQKSANRAVTRAILEYDMRHGYRRQKKVNVKKKLADNVPINEILAGYSKVGILLPGVVSSIEHDKAIVKLSDTKEISVAFNDAKWARTQLKDGTRGAEPKELTDIITKGDIIYVKLLSETRAALSQVPEVEGALVAISPRDGSVQALVGGFDYKQSSFNRATQAERQPGSAFKPFIYVAALDNGFTNASIINDAPIVQENLNDDQDWRPQNHTRKFYGPTRFRVGITKSRNLVSIRVLRSVGIDTTIKYLENLGFNADKMPHGLSLALGANHVTPLELAARYCVFPNGGHKIEPHFISSISKQQKPLYSANPLKACHDCSIEEKAPVVVKPQHAYIMTSLLQDAISSGAGRSVNLGRSDLAGKTGSTNDHMDAWYAGYNGDLVVTTWLGYDEPKTLKEYAVKSAFPMWIYFMQPVLKNKPESNPAEPEGLVTVKIDPATGKLASSDEENAVYEIFTLDTVPTEMAASSSTEGKANEDELEIF